jgi:HTH-type transcriptional regulator, transcriptional repressor of NAD biosynthesis genes
MKTGLVIGKFMPPHMGHMYMIREAAKRVDQLYVAVCARDFEPIPGLLRFKWVGKELEDVWPKVRPIYIDKPLPDAPYPSENVSRAWAEFFKAMVSRGSLEKIDTVFSSEAYGPMFAKHLGADHFVVDIGREQVPISATMIREHPIRHWDMIVPSARWYFSKKVCVCGPESTGKSTLAKNLAARFNTTFVHETACDLFPDRHCEYSDMPLIVPRHFGSVCDALNSANKILFVDTDLIITQVYSQHYFGEVPDNAIEYQRKESYDGHLFCEIDVPWVDENFRDLGHIRPFMRDWFLNELLVRGIKPFFVCGKDWDSRTAMAEMAVAAILRQPFKQHSFVKE